MFNVPSGKYTPKPINYGQSQRNSLPRERGWPNPTEQHRLFTGQSKWQCGMPFLLFSSDVHA